MERLSIDEVIAHCNRRVESFERFSSREECENWSIDSPCTKEYWEHRQVAKWLKQLKSYKDADEQGLLLKLPCKIGDSLYQPIHKDINEYKVIGICFDITRNEWLFEVAIQIGLEWIKTVCEFSCIGKTVFLTKEEAERALKQMGE